jgi:sporulation protein YlmC with PRC-barrel domain
MFTGNPDSGTQITNSRRLIQEENVASEDRLRELEEKYEDYKVYDNQGERIGKVDDLFVDETDREEYIGVKMGFFGLKSTLIPMDIVRVNEGERTIEVAESKANVKDAPTFDDDEDITPEYEDRIRSHFGLESIGTSPRGGYEAHSGGGDYADRKREPQDFEAEVDSTDYDRTSADPEYGERAEPTERGDDPRDTTGYMREASEGRSSMGSTGPFTDETSRETPTTPQTEETETFQEGGRSKIRRRVIREEIIEEDDAPDTRS